MSKNLKNFTVWNKTNTRQTKHIVNKYFSLGPFIIHDVLEKSLIAESVITGRLTYLNKDLCRVIPEKSIETYKNLPSLAKLKLGGGHTYENWLTLWAEGTLIEEFNRSRDETNYGDEGPLSYPEDSAGEIPEKEGEKEGAQEVPPADVSQSSEESDSLAELGEPRLNLPLTVPDPPSDPPIQRQVRFAGDLPTRRSSRTVRAPDKLDL
jgi:hypothetical protein